MRTTSQNEVQKLLSLEQKRISSHISCNYPSALQKLENIEDGSPEFFEVKQQGGC